MIRRLLSWLRGERRCKARHNWPTFTSGYTKAEHDEIMRGPFGRCQLTEGHQGMHLVKNDRRTVRWDGEP